MVQQKGLNRIYRRYLTCSLISNCIRTLATWFDSTASMSGIETYIHRFGGSPTREVGKGLSTPQGGPSLHFHPTNPSCCQLLLSPSSLHKNLFRGQNSYAVGIFDDIKPLSTDRFVILLMANPTIFLLFVILTSLASILKQRVIHVPLKVVKALFAIWGCLERSDRLSRLLLLLCVARASRCHLHLHAIARMLDFMWRLIAVTLHATLLSRLPSLPQLTWNRWG